MKKFLALLAVVCLGLPAWGDSYLILPFVNASHNRSLDWIGESVSESIREALASQGLVALGREERQEGYRRLGLRLDAQPTRATIFKIGQMLDADQVVYGEFDVQPPPAGSPSGRGSLKITAHVIDLRGLKQGPEFSETGPMEDLAAGQARLAWQTLQILRPGHTPPEAEFRRQHPQIRMDAMENYIRGLLETGVEQKQRLFLQAVRLEPSFSQACYQLGMLAYAKQDYRSGADWLERVPASDPTYRQALFYLGICRFRTGNYAAAQTAFELVAKTVPLNEVLNNLGAAQSRLNKPEAIENFSKALEGDPSDPLYQFNAGYALWRQGKFEAAAERFRAVLDRDPNDGEATTMLGRSLRHTGPAPVETTARLERLKTVYEESAYWQLKAVLQPDKTDKK